MPLDFHRALIENRPLLTPLYFNLRKKLLDFSWIVMYRETKGSEVERKKLPLFCSQSLKRVPGRVESFLIIISDDFKG